MVPHSRQIDFEAELREEILRHRSRFFSSCVATR
jgi:hypothetical protein